MALCCCASQSGFTFDTHLFPYPADSMGYLHALGLPVTLNIHDASGVNNWDAMFPELAKYLGLPDTATKVCMCVYVLGLLCR